MHSLENI